MLWEAIREQLERRGVQWRGKVTRPDLGSVDLRALTSMLGRRPPQRLDLSDIESALIGIGVGTDLDDALDRLGASPSADRAMRRRSEATRQEMEADVRGRVAIWPDEWATGFGDELLRSGRLAALDPVSALNLLDDVRALLDEIEPAVTPSEGSGRRWQRNDLAAHLFGSAHALDDGAVLERCARVALRLRFQRSAAEPAREVWAAAGVDADRVSAPVLSWNLSLSTGSVLGRITSAGTDGGVPIHLSLMALRRHRIEPASLDPVLLVENPRLVEAAAERMTPWSVIATNGNPSTAVVVLVDALVAAGVEVRHHGDFDAAGIAICRRMAVRGSMPWQMAGFDYESAVQQAEADGVELPVGERPCGPTPWDPDLAMAFDSRQRVVHEERLIDSLLDPHRW